MSSRAIKQAPPLARFAAARRLLPTGKTLSPERWWRRHRAILILLWVHVVVIPFYGVGMGKGLGHSLLEAAIVFAPAVIATSSGPSRKVRTWAGAIGILSSSAVLVHLSGGLIEMHFHFFVMVALVALYQDWLPFLLAIGYVLIHHGLIGALDPGSVYNHPAALAHPWRWAAVHAFFILAMSAICVVTWRFNETAVGAAESAQQRLALLAEASRIMASSLDLDDTLRNIARLSVPILADVCVIDLVEEDGSIRRAASHARGTSAARLLERRTPDLYEDRSPIIRVLRTGRSLALGEGSPELDMALGAAPDVGTDRDGLLTSALIVPLPGKRGILGSVSFATTAATSRRLEKEDLSLGEELGRRAAASVENARLFAKERSVAETLQRSLLPERLPDIPGIATAVRYVPAGEAGEVGGDWYDTFVLPGGSVAVVMGDVVGRGIPAAALMGQLRNATRAHSIDGLPPAEVAAKLNRLLQGGDPQRSLATLVYAVLDPATGEVTMVNAGHPPPLLIRSDGSTEFGEEGLAVPLGALPHASFPESSVTMGPGDTLLLYTDGLVEDRETPLGEGLERLKRAVVECASSDDLEHLGDEVLAATLGPGSSSDDAALLAVRLLPMEDRLTVRVRNDSAILASLRAMMRRWLAHAGATEEETFDILVASGEACANAIEHAHGPRATTFELEAVRDGDISISVRDNGGWRAPRPGGGRGLPLMRALMDKVEIRKSEEGTEVRLTRRLGSTRAAS